MTGATRCRTSGKENKMDIYKSSLKYAKENGELEQYRESMNLCDECGTFISHSIAENFNNNYLDVKKSHCGSRREIRF